MAGNSLTVTLALQLANPRSWVASVYPAVLGVCYALDRGYNMTAGTAAALLAAAVAMQSAVNTLNDYYDFVKGTDSLSDHVEVRDAAMLYGGFPPRQAFWLGMGFLVMAGVMAVPVCIGAGAAPFVIGLIGAAIVWLYSGGMLPISYLPVGEGFSGFVMGGLIPLGIVAAVTGTYDWPVLWAALPMICSIGLIMMTNNTCDIEKDREAGRRTLPVLLGRSCSVYLYRLMCLVWLLTMGGAAILFFGRIGAVIPLLALMAGWKHGFSQLFSARLMPELRIDSMRFIVMTNIIGNGVYLIAWMLAAGGAYAY